MCFNCKDGSLAVLAAFLILFLMLFPVENFKLKTKLIY